MATPPANIIWHEEALPTETLRALKYLSTQVWLKKSSWYLAGGTALALQANHRRSLDLDFFSPGKTFNPQVLVRKFSKEVWHTDIAEEGTVYGKVSGAKVSFISYPFFIDREKPLWYGSVRVLGKKDIAVMKIIAISQRGRKRDFVDLFWYANHIEPIEAVFLRLPDQYPDVAHNYHHILKSLTYFDDAESDPLPELFFKTSWEQIKLFFRITIPKVTLALWNPRGESWRK